MKTKKSLFAGKYAFWYTGIVCTAVFLVVCAIRGCFVFGNGTLASGEFAGQYLPMLEELREKIFSSGLTYSWASGLGADFYTEVCYFLLSPFSLLAIILKPLNASTVFDLTVILKASFAGIAFSYYIHKSRNEFGIKAIVFSLCYVFCGFFAAYCSNLMWLDALIFLPLIALGIERAANGGSGVLYCVTLACAIFSCFYTGYILCIFSVLYFFIRLIGCNSFMDNYEQEDEDSEKEAAMDANTAEEVAKEASEGVVAELSAGEAADAKDDGDGNGDDDGDEPYDGPRLITVLGKFAVYSLLAGAAAAVVLLPLYGVISGTYYLSTTPDFLYTASSQLLSGFLLGGNTLYQSVVASIMPNLFCGLLSLMLVPVFLFIKSIPVKERVCYIVLTAGLAASLIIPQLNLVWHGFYYPEVLPHRFTFLLAFIITVMAYRAFSSIKDVHVAVIPVCGAICTAMCVYVALSDTALVVPSVAWACAALAVLFTVGLLIIRLTAKPAKIAQIAVLLLAAAEVVASLGISVSVNDSITDAQAERDAVKSISKNASSDGLYRSGVVGSTLNEGFGGGWYGINSIDTSLPLTDEWIVYTVGNLGLRQNRDDTILYSEQTPVFNSMFGVKYLYDIGGSVQDTSNFTELASENDITLYENADALPVMYATGNAVRDWNSTYTYNFGAQNTLFEAACGVPDVFYEISPDEKKGTKGKLSELSKSDVQLKEDIDFNNYYEMKFSQSVYDSSVSFTLHQKGTDKMYAFYSSYIYNSLTVEAQGETTEYLYNSDYTSYIIPLPDVGDGGEVKLTASFKPQSELSDSEKKKLDALESTVLILHVYALDDAKYEQGMEILNASNPQIEKIKDTYIKGTVTLAEGQTVFTTIPYSEGWTAYVDGVKTETTCSKSYLLTVDAGEGEHTIELKYSTPYLGKGAAISAAAVLLIILAAYLEKKHREKYPEYYNKTED